MRWAIDLNHHDDSGAAGHQHDRDHHAVIESPLSDGRVVVGIFREAVQEVCGLLRFGSGRDDGAAVMAL